MASSGSINRMLAFCMRGLMELSTKLVSIDSDMNDRYAHFAWHVFHVDIRCLKIVANISYQALPALLVEQFVTTDLCGANFAANKQVSSCIANIYNQSINNGSRLLVQLDILRRFSPDTFNHICMLLRSNRDFTIERLRDTHPSWHHCIQWVDFLSIHLPLRDVEPPHYSTDIQEQRLLGNVHAGTHSAASSVRNVVPFIWIGGIDICCRR